MRRLAWILAAILAASGCAYYKVQTMPKDIYSAEDLDSGRYEVGKTVRESRYGFRLLTIPISMPDPLEIAAEQIRQGRAVGLTNMTVEFSEFGGADFELSWAGVLAFLFQVPRVSVSGALVYRREPPAAAAAAPVKP